MSAKNVATRGSHVCLPTACPSGRQGAVLYVLHDASGPRVKLPFDCAVPTALKPYFMETHDDATRQNARLLDEYAALGLLLQRQCSLRFISFEEFETTLMTRPTAFTGLLAGVDLICCGRWPYVAARASLFRERLDSFCRLLGVRCFPPTEDLLFAADKHRYLSALERQGVPVIPTVYLHPVNLQLADIEAALALLDGKCNQRLRTSGFALKRGRSGCARHVLHIRGRAPKAIAEAIVASTVADDAETFWLLQPWVASFSHHPELKLYLGPRAECLTAVALRPAPDGAPDDVRELRPDSKLWTDHDLHGALTFARQVRSHVVAMAPGLAAFLRVDVIYDDDRSAFILNELDHFGEAHLLPSDSNLGLEQLERFAAAIKSSFAASDRTVS